MSKIKSVLAAAFLLVSIVSFAQPPGGGQKGGQQGPPPVPTAKEITKMVSELAETISLSEAQEVKVLEIYNNHFAEVTAKTSSNNRPKREEMEALNTTFEKQVNAELTAEQKTKYETFLKEQSSKRQRK